jgi:hypothetical protein
MRLLAATIVAFGLLSSSGTRAQDAGALIDSACCGGTGLWYACAPVLGLPCWLCGELGSVCTTSFRLCGWTASGCSGQPPASPCSQCLSVVANGAPSAPDLPEPRYKPLRPRVGAMAY